MDEKHAVWVGSLSSSANEEILSGLFGKFGPVKSVVIVRDEQGKSKQFGYVNYYNREVADCAAHVMDGYIILRQAIKTKGPKELQKLRAEQSAGKKDYRAITDCLFFIDGRECTWKSGECPFRHCQQAKNTEDVCEKWIERQCEDAECHNRHPRLTRHGSLINDTSANRCPSHNAFKCFGECGNKDCNTHFLEHVAYLEHVRSAKKKPAHPIATCMKCQAVFFDGPEKLNHWCHKNDNKSHSDIQHFTSTRVQAEKDIAHPVATYPTKPISVGIPQNCARNPVNTPASQQNHVSSSVQNRSSNHKENIPSLCDQIHRTRISTGPRLKNVGYSSSTMSFCDGSRQGSVVSCGQTETSCSMSDFKPRNDVEPVGVFWDFENCPIPKGKSALAIVRKLRSVFFKDRREAEFMCVCDISKEKRAVIEELNKAQVTVVHINSTSKNAADDKLRQSLRRFAQTYCRPATVILVSGDGNFTVELSDLRHRHNFQIICLHNINASSALLGFAHESHRFDLFAEDLEVFTPVQVTSKPWVSTDVLITNLPSTKSATLLKSMLTKLSDNCGGKVLTVSGTKAIIRFPNSEAAFRARRRLDKEELFGSILRATLLPQGNHKELLAARREQNDKESGLNKDTTVATTSTASMEKYVSTPGNLRVEQKSREESKTLIHSRSGNNSDYEHVQRQNNPVKNFTQYSPSSVLNHRLHHFSSNAMYGNLFHPPVVHSMIHLNPVTTSPFHTLGPRMFTPAGPFSPVGNTAVRRSPSPDQHFGGVDLLVTNLDETFSKKEIKKKLGSVFREHCKVYSVVLHARSGAPLRALVKVSKLVDAHLAISKVTGKLVLGRVVHVSIASEKDKELCYLQDEVVAVLEESPLSWLNLPTFLKNFEKKYRRCLDVRHLDQIKDSVVINGSTGCQTISLLEGKVETELVEVDGMSFASDVFKLLHHYEGAIPLSCFPALYWLEFHQDIRPSSSGKLLADLLSILPNVTVTETTLTRPGRSVQWIKAMCSPCDASSLLQLSLQLVEILQEDHEFDMTIEELQDRFLSTYDKPLDASLYGFQSIEDLLCAFLSVIEVDEAKTCVSLIRTQRVKLFAKEITELLLQNQDNTVLLSNFMAAYVKYFGQKFKVASFGFNRLTDLIKAIPDVAEIDGAGDQRTVTLAHRKGKTHAVHSSLDKLAEELTNLLNGAKDSEISLNSIVQAYHQQYGRHLTLEGYGCATLNGLVELLSGFQIVQRGTERFLQFFTKPNTDVVKKDLVALLKRQENKVVMVKNIPKAYEKLFLRKFPYTVSSLKELLQTTKEHWQILGHGNDQIVKLLDDEETEIEVEFFSTKTAVEILTNYPEYSCPKSTFLPLYRHKLQRYKIFQEEKPPDCSVPICVMIRRQGNEDFVTLKRDYCTQILVEQLKELLSSSTDMSLPVSDLQRRYQEHFKVKMNLSSCGCEDIFELKERLQGFVEMTAGDSDSSDNRLTLSPLSRFEVETQSLLKSCGGCISLNRFAPAYQQMFSKACVVADFGYSKLSSLLNAVPHVARIVGNGPEKIVIAVDVSIPERICTDLLSIRIINEENSEVGLPREDGEESSSGLAQESVGFVKSSERRSSLSASEKPIGEEDLQMGPPTEVSNHSSNVSARSKESKLRSSVPRDERINNFPSSNAIVRHLDFNSSTALGNQIVPKDHSVPISKLNDSCTSSPRSTPQKLRLAAKFNFPVNT